MALEVTRWPEDLPLTLDTVSHVWAQQGFDCALWIDPPGQAWIDFVHPTDELVLVKEGVVELEVEGERVTLYPGDQLLIPAGKIHSMWNRGEKPACWFYGYRRYPVKFGVA